jgi:hypothetical protein
MILMASEREVSCDWQVDVVLSNRLRVNKLVLKIASWVASAMLRRVELWDDNLVIPPALAARAAVLAFGDDLMDLKLPNEPTRSALRRLALLATTARRRRRRR